jgi:hypothetical protein
MSSVAYIRSLPAAEGQYLGPGEVLESGSCAVEVRLRHGAVVRAELALPAPYAAEVGDSLLVIGNAEGHYVIGVLSGSGRTELSFRGDVDLRAGGTLRLSAERGVRIEAPEVEMRAGKLKTFAGAVTQTFTELRQRVIELLSVQAGQTHTVVQGSTFTQSKSATLLTEEKVTINGKAIHLG